jgi:hypothetical protein
MSGGLGRESRLQPTVSTVSTIILARRVPMLVMSDVARKSSFVGVKNQKSRADAICIVLHWVFSAIYDILRRQSPVSDTCTFHSIFYSRAEDTDPYRPSYHNFFRYLQSHSLMIIYSRKHERDRVEFGGKEKMMLG